MSKIITMPQLGETVTEGTVLSWLVKAGDVVSEDDPILEISTDKVDTEVPSPFSGTVTALLVEEGETVAVGANLLELDGDSQDIVETHSEVPEPEIQEEPEIVENETGEEVSSVVVESDSDQKLSPVVRKLLSKNNLNPSSLNGTGKDGRITRKDIEAHIATGERPSEEKVVKEPVAEKPESEVDKEPESLTLKTSKKKGAPVEELRPATRPDKIKTKAPTQPLQEQPKEIPTKAKPDKKQDKKRSKEAEPDQWDKEGSKKPAKRRVEFGKGARKKNVLDYYSSSEMRGPRKRKVDRAKDRKGDPDLVKGEEEAKHVFNPRKKKIKVGNQVTIGELAGLIGIKATNILKKMMEEGTMTTINQIIPGETAALLAADFDVEVELATFELEDLLNEEEICGFTSSESGIWFRRERCVSMLHSTKFDFSKNL